MRCRYLLWLVILSAPTAMLQSYWLVWIFSHPIEQLQQYSVENLPTTGAKSFTVSQQQAIYFIHGPVSDEPVIFYILSAGLVLAWGLMVWLFLQWKRTHTNNSASI